MTYEEAKAKAKKIMPSVNAAYELQHAWMFYNANQKKTEDDSEVVILKSNGNAVNYGAYSIHYKDNQKPKKIAF